MKNVDLTLAICMYNAERFIEQTLLGVISQTMQNFHLLIVDDCSTDNSIEITERFFEQHPRQYEIIRFEQNQGIAYARNTILNGTKTKYLIFIDSDDIPLPTLVEKEYSTLTSDKDLMGVASCMQYINKEGKALKGGHFLGDRSKELFIERAKKMKLIFLPIQTMFDRECAIRVGGFNCSGFPEGNIRYRDFCEDLDLWTRMSDLYVEGKAFISLQEVLYKYRKTEGLSCNKFNMILKMRYIKKNLLRRRAGIEEITFSKFLRHLTNAELKKIKKEARAAEKLRNGVIFLNKNMIIKGLILIAYSIWIKPSYFIEKMKYNSGLKKI